MSGPMSLPSGADTALLDALLAAISADAAVQAEFGAPARIFDGETRKPAFPFARIQRHEWEDASSIGVEGRVHQVTLATASREGGRREVARLLGVLKDAAEKVGPVLSGQAIVSCRGVYADIVRAPDRDHFRGSLRLRIVSRAVEPAPGGVS
ncbi:MAG: DUF3168 domain-containing protein [Pseudomonadota bacterium]